MISPNYFSNISFAGLLYLMGNPWFQKGMQSLFQLSSTGAYTVHWNLDIQSRSAKQWINFKLKMFHVMWKQQNQCLVQTYLGNLWHYFNRCHCYHCCWVWATWERIVWFWYKNWNPNTCSRLLGPYHCHPSNSYWVCARGWQVLQLLYMLPNQVLSSCRKNRAWCWQHGLTEKEIQSRKFRSMISKNKRGCWK